MQIWKLKHSTGNWNIIYRRSQNERKFLCLILKERFRKKKCCIIYSTFRRIDCIVNIFQHSSYFIPILHTPTESTPELTSKFIFFYVDRKICQGGYFLVDSFSEKKYVWQRKWQNRGEHNHPPLFFCYSNLTAQ